MSTMCSLSKKYLGKDNEKYIEYLDNPKYMCKNCGRLANSSDNLCKPTPIENSLSKENKNDKKRDKKIKKLKTKIQKLKKRLK